VTHELGTREKLSPPASKPGPGSVTRCGTASAEAARRHVIGVLVAVASLSIVAAAHSPAQDPARGTVVGVVRFVGEVPPPLIVIQGADEQPVLYVDESGALQYAVVYLTV